MFPTLFSKRIFDRPWRQFVSPRVVFVIVLMTAGIGFISMSVKVSAELKPKKVVLIGATALAAPDLINQALNAGHEVIGVARRPEAVKIQDAHFQVVKGDVYDSNSIENVLTGDEVVVSYIDIKMPFGQEVMEEIDLFSKGTANIIHAMESKGNRVLIIASAVGAENILLTEPSEDAMPSEKLAWERRRKYEDVRRMETIVRASDLDYIILRLPHLVAEPARGPVNVVVNKDIYDVIIKGESEPRTLSKIDLSRFIVEQLYSDKYYGKTVGLYN